MKYDKQNPPRSVCIMRISAIGDVCHTIPVVKTLQQYWPYTKITWIIGKTEYSLLKGLPNIEFIVFDKSLGLGAYVDLRRQLKGKEYDLLLHMQEALRASIASLFVKAKYRLGYSKNDCQDMQWIFTNTRVEYKPRIHYMERLLLFTETLKLTPPVIEWNVPVNSEDNAIAMSVIPKNKPYIVISPCSSIVKNNYRNWTIERYAEVTRIIENEFHHTVILTGGKSALEKEFGEFIEYNARVPVTNLIGKLNLKQLLIVLKNASAVISPDSGPAHMANTVGTPVIALFATSNPDFTGPYYNRDWIINKYPEALLKYNQKTIEEAPWGNRVRVPEAMEMIEVEDVRNKLLKLNNIAKLRAK